MISGFRWVGWLEGLSFLLLLGVAMPLKYVAGQPEMVRWVGAAHGGLFIAYVLYAFYLAQELSWPLKIRLLALLASVLPFGTFVFERRCLSESK